MIVHAPIRLYATLPEFQRAAIGILTHYRKWEPYEAGFYVDLLWTDTGESIDPEKSFTTGSWEEAIIVYFARTQDMNVVDKYECYEAIATSAEFRARAMKEVV